MCTVFTAWFFFSITFFSVNISMVQVKVVTRSGTRGLHSRSSIQDKVANISSVLISWTRTPLLLMISLVEPSKTCRQKLAYKLQFWKWWFWKAVTVWLALNKKWRNILYEPGHRIGSVEKFPRTMTILQMKNFRGSIAVEYMLCGHIFSWCTRMVMCLPAEWSRGIWTELQFLFTNKSNNI